MAIDSLTIRRPDDWHVHLRDGEVLRGVVPYTARQFERAIVMPNLSPPVTSPAAVVAYRERILAAVPEGIAFTPLMTAYLTDSTDPVELARGYADGAFVAAKLGDVCFLTCEVGSSTPIELVDGVAEVLGCLDPMVCDPKRIAQRRLF